MPDRYCHRWWLRGPDRGVGLCQLRAGHGGTYCIDTVHNLSHPRIETNLPRNPRERELVALLEAVLL
jgi:hypothetical protein